MRALFIQHCIIIGAMAALGVLALWIGTNAGLHIDGATPGECFIKGSLTILMIGLAALFYGKGVTGQ